MCLYLSIAWVVSVMDQPSQVGGQALLEVVYTATKAGSEVAYSELWPPGPWTSRPECGINAFSA